MEGIWNIHTHPSTWAVFAGCCCCCRRRAFVRHLMVALDKHKQQQEEEEERVSFPSQHTHIPRPVLFGSSRGLLNALSVCLCVYLVNPSDAQ